MEEAQTDYVVNVDLGPDRSPLRFATVEAVCEWVDEERQFWQWLQAAGRGGHTAIGQTFSRADNAWRQVENNLSGYDESDEQGKTAARNQVATTLVQLYRDLNFPISCGPRAQYIAGESKKDPQRAGYVLVSWVLPEQLPMQQDKAIQGLVLASVFDNSIPKEGVAAEKSALDHTRLAWNKFERKAQARFAEFQTQLQTFTAEMGEDQGAHRQQFDEMIEQFKRDVDGTRKFVQEQLILEAPVKYWTKKAKGHDEQSKRLTKIFGVAIGGFIAAYTIAIKYLILVPEADLKTQTLRLALVTAIAGTLAWPLRMLGRSLSSHLHLKSDAEQRVAMANVFLALLAEDNAVQKDEDRRLILDALFRPAVTGLIKEETAPLNLQQLLARALDKKP